MLQTQLLPFPELFTERLHLRRIIEADTESIFSLRNNKEVMKYVPNKCNTMADAVVFYNLINSSLEAGIGITWGISLRQNSNELIGTIAFWRLMKEHYRAEIGYMLDKPFWGKGLMREAIKKVMEYGFEKMKLHSVEAQLSPENHASEKILQTTGFVKEAHFKENYFTNGIFEDTLVYSKVAQ